VLAEFAVDLEFFCGQPLQHLVVAATVGFGDEGAELALAAFEVAMLEGVESVFDLLGHGLAVGVGVFEGTGEKNVAWLVVGYVEWIGGCGSVG
jgi:hypothetical protein